MRVDLLSREYPPDVYGGAGVHVDYLVRELREAARALDDEIRVHCFGDERPGATAYGVPGALAGANPALQTLGVDVAMAEGCSGADVVHSHTWYANLAGHMAKLLYGIPHVLTTHSLEPLRPWKAEQLGGGYALSSWAERTAILAADAVIAVSAGMRRDVLSAYPELDPDRVSVIHNGIDTKIYAPDHGTGHLDALGIDPGRPSVVFVGRVTRQKGLPHLLRAASQIDPEAQLVLCAGAADTPALEAEVAATVADLKDRREHVLWIPGMLSRDALIQILTHASVFVCPSIYEPMGIVNLEAMACGAPVVATATGGIPEVVADGETGLLVPLEQAPDGTPYDPARFAGDLASRINALLSDPSKARAMGEAGRTRATTRFSWSEIAHRTHDLYGQTLSRHR
ncbi:glycogen synthase [Actinocorallia longicatena]|uniref:Glycogen synthase n=1 Tax=Actinocorallia longicatena TaxID=111803 RepID=A0ABP6QBS0_9ACTN